MEARLAAMLCLSALALFAVVPAALAQCLGSFTTLGDIAISPITVSQSIDGSIYLFDRRDLYNSRLILPDGSTGHAVEYFPNSNTWRPITTVTNTWCSAGGYLPDGTIMNTAGNDAGRNAVRTLCPCSVKSPRKYFGGANPPVCNQWWENSTIIKLAATRWYPTDQVLPDGRHFLLGGSTGGTDPYLIVPSYEFVNPYSYVTGPIFDMPFLREGIPYFLYPFVHLLPSDLLFIFVNVKGIIFNYKTNSIVVRVPNIPDNVTRSYPGTAASLMLPLSASTGFTRAEILICGGNKGNADKNFPASRNCYLTDVSLTSINANSITWKGPFNLARGRVMPDLIYLADGKYLIINGAQRGVAGYDTASLGNLSPEVLFRNTNGGITVYSNYCPSPITRGYHSEAILIPDGRVLISGSNPWGQYTTQAGNPFSTEYRIEMWTPPYVSQTAIPRPVISNVPATITYNQRFTVSLSFPRTPNPAPATSNMRVSFVSNAFTTHSISMHLRWLDVAFSIAGNTVSITSPPSSVIAPPGPYMLVVAYNKIPSKAIWVKIG